MSATVTRSTHRTPGCDLAHPRWDIFHYVYAVLHHPEYRERYAANLKRELPRMPFVGVALLGGAGLQRGVSETLDLDGAGLQPGGTLPGAPEKQIPQGLKPLRVTNNWRTRDAALKRRSTKTLSRGVERVVPAFRPA